MAVKYQIEFDSQKYNHAYKLLIINSDYTGAPVAINAGAGGIVLRKDTDGIFRGSSLDISIEVPIAYPWGLTDLYSNHGRQHKVELYKNNTLIWSGFLVPEEYADPIIDPPFDITLRAIDGLGLLKTSAFAIPSTDASMPLIAAINHCLANTGLSLNVADSINVWEQSHLTTLSPLYQTYIKPAAFYTDGTAMMCDEALSVMLQSFDPDITITQAQNMWIISRGITIADDNYYIHAPNNSHVGIQTLNKTIELAHVDDYAAGKCFAIGSLSRQIVPQPQDVTIEQDYGMLENAIPWGDSNNDPMADGRSTIWHFVQAPTVYARSRKQTQSYWTMASGTGDISYYTHNKQFAVFTSNSDGALHLTLRSNVAATIGVKVIIANTYYLSATGWTTTPSIVTINISAGTDAQTYHILMNGFPATGNLQIHLGDASTSIEVQKVALGFYDESGDIYASSKTTLQIIEPNAINHLSFGCYGDVPADANAINFYNNCFLKPSGAPTAAWKQAAETAFNPLSVVFCRSVASNYRAIKQRITGVLMGNTVDVSASVTYPSFSNKLFLISSASHDLYADELEVELIEQLPYVESLPNIETSPLYSSANTSNTVNSNNDYVVVADQLGEGKRIPQLPTATVTAGKFLMIDAPTSQSAEKVPYVEPLPAADFANMFELAGTAPNQYLLAKYPFASVGNLFGYTANGFTPPSFWAGMPYAGTNTVGGVKVDGVTITINAQGVISASVENTGGGFDIAANYAPTGAWNFLGAATLSGEAIATQLHVSTNYEPKITKAIGFLKWTGTAFVFVNEAYSLSSHNHSGTYEPVLSAGTTAQYYRGDKTWQTLNSAAVAELTNLYFTEARVRAAVLTGYAAGTNTALSATDSLLTAFGKVQGQLNAREATLSAGTTAQYYRGDKTWQTLNSAAVPELNNLYFTDARVRAAVLTGYAVGANTALAATDSVLTAFGKVQGQLNGKASINGASDQDFSTRNLNIYGEISYIYSQTIIVDDAFVQVNTGNAAVDAGLIADNGTTYGARIFWRVSDGAWVFGNNGSYQVIQPLIAAGTTAQYYRGDKTWQTLNSAAVPELTNLYFTEARVRAAVLTGYAAGTNTALAATDSLLTAFGKVQGQLNAREATLSAGTTAQYYRGDKTWQTLNSAAVPELTNLYFTNARALAAITGNASKVAGQFYTGTTNPTNSSRLNYDGYLWATKLYSNAIEVATLTAAQTLTNKTLDAPSFGNGVTLASSSEGTGSVAMSVNDGLLFEYLDGVLEFPTGLIAIGDQTGTGATEKLNVFGNSRIVGGRYMLADATGALKASIGINATNNDVVVYNASGVKMASIDQSGNIYAVGNVIGYSTR